MHRVLRRTIIGALASRRPTWNFVRPVTQLAKAASRLAAPVRGTPSAAALLLTIFAFPALGQTEPHERFHQYYQTWKQPGMYGLSCCNANEYVDTLNGRMHIAGDCEPTRAEIRNGHWWAKVPDYMIEAGVPAWVEIPDDKVIHERNPSYEEGHLCGTVEYWQGKPPTVRILCFVPPDTGG